MPKLKTAQPKPSSTAPPTSPTQAKQAAPPPANDKVDGAKILHPTFRWEDRTSKKAMTEADMKKLLGWETEAELHTRQIQSGAWKKVDDAIVIARGKDEGKAVEEIDWLLQDGEGNNVICWHSRWNRPYESARALRYRQEMLMRRWRLSSQQTFGVSKTGKLINGNHRGIGFILACQELRKNRAYWDPRGWDGKELTFECWIGYGDEETPDVLQTLDNTKVRELSDGLFTANDLFKGVKDRLQRIMLAKALDAAVDTLWRRTGYADQDSWHKYQTNAESKEFLDHHRRLEQAVLQVAECNAGRGLVLFTPPGQKDVHWKTGLQPGPAAAWLYLMGSAGSDIDAYRAQDTRSEDNLDWDLWDRAVAFWTEFCDAKKHMVPLAKALSALYDPDSLEVKGRPASAKAAERSCLVAKAWEVFQGGSHFEADDLELAHRADAEGVMVLDEYPGFGGIDLGPPRPKEDEPEPTEEEIQARKKAVRAQSAKEMAARVDKTKAPDEVAKPAARKTDKEGKPLPQKVKEPTQQERLDHFRAQYPGQMLLLKAPTCYNLWQGDALIGQKVLGLKPVKEGEDEMWAAWIAKKDLEASVKKLAAAKQKFVIIDSKGASLDTTKEIAESKAATKASKK